MNRRIERKQGTMQFWHMALRTGVPDPRQGGPLCDLFDTAAGGKLESLPPPSRLFFLGRKSIYGRRAALFWMGLKGPPLLVRCTRGHTTDTLGGWWDDMGRRNWGGRRAGSKLIVSYGWWWAFLLRVEAQGLLIRRHPAQNEGRQQPPQRLQRQHQSSVRGIFPWGKVGKQA